MASSLLSRPSIDQHSVHWHPSGVERTHRPSAPQRIILDHAVWESGTWRRLAVSELQPNALTPREALELIYKLKAMLKE